MDVTKQWRLQAVFSYHSAWKLSFQLLNNVRCTTQLSVSKPYGHSHTTGEALAQSKSKVLRIDLLSCLRGSASSFTTNHMRTPVMIMQQQHQSHSKLGCTCQTIQSHAQLWQGSAHTFTCEMVNTLNQSTHWYMESVLMYSTNSITESPERADSSGSKCLVSRVRMSLSA